LHAYLPKNPANIFVRIVSGSTILGGITGVILVAYKHRPTQHVMLRICSATIVRIFNKINGRSV